MKANRNKHIQGTHQIELEIRKHGRKATSQALILNSDSEGSVPVETNIKITQIMSRPNLSPFLYHPFLYIWAMIPLSSATDCSRVVCSCFPRKRGNNRKQTTLFPGNEHILNNNNNGTHNRRLFVCSPGRNNSIKTTIANITHMKPKQSRERNKNT